MVPTVYSHTDVSTEQCVVSYAIFFVFVTDSDFVMVFHRVQVLLQMNCIIKYSLRSSG